MSKTRDVWERVVALNSGLTMPLGPDCTDAALIDTKHLCFTLSRYKFCAKILARAKETIEIGSGEGLGALTVINDTNTNYLGIDFYRPQVDYVNDTVLPNLEKVAPEKAKRVRFECRDILVDVFPEQTFDSLISVDVIEHIEPGKEDIFLSKCAGFLEDKGIAIIGTPNKLASQYASELSQIGHINLYEPDRFVTSLERHFTHAIIFSMNDEVVHTGFSKLAHYLIAVCIK